MDWDHLAEEQLQRLFAGWNQDPLQRIASPAPQTREKNTAPA